MAARMLWYSEKIVSVFIIEKEAKLLYKVVMKLLVLRINKCGLSFTKTRWEVVWESDSSEEGRSESQSWVVLAGKGVRTYVASR